MTKNNIPPRITAGECPILASFFLFLYFQKCFIKRLENFVQLHSLAGIFGLQLSIETLFVICLCESCVQISNEICRNFRYRLCYKCLKINSQNFRKRVSFFQETEGAAKFFLTHVFIKFFPIFLCHKNAHRQGGYKKILWNRHN